MTDVSLPQKGLWQSFVTAAMTLGVPLTAITLLPVIYTIIPDIVSGINFICHYHYKAILSISIVFIFSIRRLYGMMRFRLYTEEVERQLVAYWLADLPFNICCSAGLIALTVEFGWLWYMTPFYVSFVFGMIHHVRNTIMLLNQLKLAPKVLRKSYWARIVHKS